MSVRVSGIGAVSTAGVGVAALAAGLRAQPQTWSTEAEGMPAARPVATLAPHDPLALLTALELPPALEQRARRVLHRMDLAQSSTLLAALEAWVDAGLHARAGALDPGRCALVIGGHNLGQRHSWDMAQRYADKLARVPPSHALSSLDSYHLGSISEVLGIRGEGMVAGAASASGSVAVIQAMRLLRAGVADRCVVAAPPCLLAPLDLHALDNLGVLARPDAAACYQPFAQDSAGLVYGQASAALVLERSAEPPASEQPQVGVWGGAMSLDGTRKPAPSVEGELGVMRRALADAQLEPEAIDYINPHASGSALGDETEARALAQLFGARLEQIWLNTTKAYLGHCLSSAGAIELVACVVQMREGFIHPGPRVGSSPVRASTGRWPGPEAATYRPRAVLKNGFGFGGINTSIVLGLEPRKRSARDERGD